MPTHTIRGALSHMHGAIERELGTSEPTTLDMLAQVQKFGAITFGVGCKTGAGKTPLRLEVTFRKQAVDKAKGKRK
jgi:hypothetical protein